VTIVRPTRETYLGLAFPAPAIRHVNQACAMDVLASVLGQGRTSRLYRRVRDQRRLVTTIGAYYSPQRRPSLLMVIATLEAGNREAAREAIDQEVRRLARKVTTRELRRAKRKIHNSLLYAAETNAGLAAEIGWAHTLTGSDDFYRTYRDRIGAVTARDVEAAARRFLDPDKAVEVAIVPSAGMD
jgi:zinc protease